MAASAQTDAAPPGAPQTAVPTAAPQTAATTGPQTAAAKSAAKPTPVGAPTGTGPELLLTFDDGPAAQLTPKVLEVLDERGIKAVFFVNGWHFMGKRAGDERAREVLRDTARRGHAIGNHTIH